MDADLLSLLNSKLNWAGAIAFCVYLLHSGVKYYLDWRAKQNEKTDAETLLRLAEQNTAAIELSKTTTASLAKTLSKVELSVTRLTESDVWKRRTLEDLLQRITGTLDKESSFHLIDKFFADFARDVGSIFTYSLEHNGYLERPEFIRDRVKTQMGQSFEALRESLQHFQLSVPIAPFFETRETDHRERFVIVDRLWTDVEPLYTSKVGLPGKLDEMRLIVQNLIKDYLTKAKKQASAIADEGRGA